MSDALEGYSPINEIIGYRDAAVLAANEGCALLAQGFAKMEEAKALTVKASGGHASHTDHQYTDPYKRLFQTFDGQKSFDQFRAHTDACTWLRLYNDTGMFALMDSDARKALTAELCGNTPEVTHESAYERLSALNESRAMIFRRGLANSFIRLDKIFKSHDPYQFDRRVILTGMFDTEGYSRYDNFAVLNDIERAFAVLDRKPNYEVGSARKVVLDARQGSSGPRQTLVHTDYFKIRVYQNGNLHLWFKRKDLVERVNLELAAYYGDVLPDGVATPEQDLRGKANTTAVSKDLAFYATPKPVLVKLLKEGLEEQLRDYQGNGPASVLEPSAGIGDLVRGCLQYTPKVTAIEVDPGRYAQLATLSRIYPSLVTVCANFLGLTARESFDVVVMNPPFCGTHYVAHVLHAYRFLKPGGCLWTILPATARYSEGGDHAKFQAWAASVHGVFYDLDPESFAASGTRINTCFLKVRKPIRR